MRRYNSFSEYLKNLFGVKVWKVSVDAGFSCPNNARCIYCSTPSFTPEYAERNTPIRQQILKGIEIIKRTRKARKFIVYFQPHTNTYVDGFGADTEEQKEIFLRNVYTEALSSHPDIVGLSIGTRPDCLSSNTIELLSELNKVTFLYVELGLQSANNNTLELIKRGHTKECFCDAVQKLKEKNIRVLAHIILGLPNESEKDWEITARFLNELKIDAVKIHPLHIVKNTEMESWYRSGMYTPIELREYAEGVAKVIGILHRNCLIARLTGEASKDTLIAPLWCKEKNKVLMAIENELEKRNIYQGSLYS